MQGWIKLHRQLLEWEWYHDTNVKVLFIHLLLLANHSEQKWRGYIIKRGQLITSTYHLADSLGLGRQQIRNALKKLERTKEISIKTTHKNTIITIENYDRYQIDGSETNLQSTQLQPSNNPEVTTNKNEINDKKGKNENIVVIGKKEKPTIEEVQKYIKEKNYNVDAEYFYNYYETNGWKVGKNKIESWKSCLEIWNKQNEKKNKQVKSKYNNYEQRKYENLDKLYVNI